MPFLPRVVSGDAYPARQRRIAPGRRTVRRMEFSDVVRSRRMVRSYLPDPIDPEVVERLLRTGRRAPSAGYSQGLGLVAVTEPERRRALGEAMGELEYGGVPWISSAPLQVVVTVDEQAYHDRYRQPDKLDDAGQEVTWPVPYWFVDAGAAMMLLLLAAVDEGLAAGFAGHPDQHARLRALLDLPAGQVPIGVVTIGHPAPSDPLAPTASGMTRGRRSDAAVLHRERWTLPA
jgi:nitroreductase